MKRALALLLTIAAPALAHANAPDTFGFGPRIAGLAGAGTAEARGQAAAFHNPAGVALSDDIEAAIAYSYAGMALRIDGRDAAVTTPRGTSLGLSLPARLGPITAAFGLAVYLPDQFIARIHLVPASEPHFALLDNNLQHVVVQPVVALRLGRRFAIGGGASILADAAGNGITFDVGVSSGNKVGQAALDVTLPVRAAPVLGLTILPKPWLRFAVAYRGELDLKLSLGILAHVDLPGAISGDTLISLIALNFYSPHTVTGAVAVDLGALTLTAQLDWLKWSDFQRAIPDLHVQIGLAIAPPLVAPAFTQPRFDDQYVVRLGAELRRTLSTHLDAAARVGYAYFPSPVPPQTGLTSFADNNRHVIAIGAGLSLKELITILPKPLSLDLALQVHQLEPRATAKDVHVTASPGFTSSGTIVQVTAGLEARF
ncbi:MAG: OmpP1/FadL family transporter [Polyangia bacterium]